MFISLSLSDALLEFFLPLVSGLSYFLGFPPTAAFSFRCYSLLLSLSPKTYNYWCALGHKPQIFFFFLYPVSKSVVFQPGLHNCTTQKALKTEITDPIPIYSNLVVLVELGYK